jgi:hypothetical protein
MVDEHMGSFGRPGPRRGATIHLGDWVHEGARRFIWTHGFTKGHDTPKGCTRFTMVTFGVPIREQGCTTKEGRFEEQGEQDQLCDSEADLDEEGRAPSRSQVAPHGRTCVSLR